MHERQRQARVVPPPINAQKARHVEEMVTPPLTNPATKDSSGVDEKPSIDDLVSKEAASRADATKNSIATTNAQDASVLSPPVTPAEAIIRQQAQEHNEPAEPQEGADSNPDEELSDLSLLRDIPISYIHKTLLALGGRFLGDARTCYAYIRAVPFDSLSPSTPPQDHDEGLPIHLEYAMFRAPYIAHILQSPYTEKGDVLDVCMPHPSLWPAVLGWIYTGRIRRDINEGQFGELLQFLHGSPDLERIKQDSTAR